MGKRKSNKKDQLESQSSKASKVTNSHTTKLKISEVYTDDEEEEITSDLNTSVSESLLDKSKVPGKQKFEKGKLPNSIKKNGKKKDATKGDDDTDTEEERWLDAIESGKLEEVDDELKRIKNPRLMTARQRALLEKRSDCTDDVFQSIPAEPLLALPSGFKEKVVTEEMLRKKEIKTIRRRKQALEKREEEKKKTVDRLLKKQDSKVSKLSKSKGQKIDVPIVTYLDSLDRGKCISFPVGFQFPLQAAVASSPPKMKLCQVYGCKNPKKYSCSRTNVWLCSKNCYDKNLRLKSVKA